MNVQDLREMITGGKMKIFKVAFSVLILSLLLSPLTSAQVDLFGFTDTIYAEVAKIDDANWTITVTIANDENIEGISIPLKMTAGMNRIVADSAVYTGGRVEHFTLKAFRPDTAIQCATLGMVANLGPTKHTLAPGSGRLVTLFISSLENKPIEKLVVDTVTTHPNNTLLIVGSTSNWGDHRLDTIKIEKRKELEIIPVFIVKQL